MNKKTYNIILCVLAGMLFLGEFLDAFYNASQFFNLERSIKASIFIVLLWLSIGLYVKIKKPKWFKINNQVIRLKKLGSQTNYFFIGMLIIIWLPFLIRILYPPPTSTDEPPTRFCAFNDSGVDTLRVAIVPFYNFDKFDGSTPEKAILDRLKEIITKDSLYAIVEFCDEYVPNPNYSENEYNVLLDSLNADLLIYGDIEPNCSEDKICINWISKSQIDYEEHAENTSKQKL